MLHQFCSPCLVLPVGGKASRGGGGEGGWRGVNKVPGLTLIVHNLKMNKQKFTNPAIFLKFNRINSLLSFSLKIDVSTTTSFSIIKKRFTKLFLPLSVKMVSIKEVVKFLLVSSPICQLRPKTEDGHQKYNVMTGHLKENYM